ncbi:MAG: HXXEE domain-containing protein [Agriterribacter sp.]
MFTYSLLSILLPSAIMLHVTEEFLFPGGFAEWYRQLVPPKTNKGIDTGYLVWINTLMIGVCVLPVYFGERGAGIWYCVAAIAAANACFHIWGVIKLKKYSPGVVTGVLLYLPLFFIATRLFLSSDLIPLSKAIMFIVIGIGYHIFSVYRQGK